MSKSLIIALVGFGLIFLASASGSAEEIRKRMVITYGDGKTQTVILDQPSCNIVRMVFGGESPQVTGRTYRDNKGAKVFVPCGARAFADRVVSYRVGSPAPRQGTQDPAQALGEPNFTSAEDVKYVTLGCGGSITLEFSRVLLVDGEGPDLHVFEIGPDVEPTRLEISKDGIAWTDIGRISGGRAAIDIRGFVSAGDQFRYVRLTDLRTACGGEWPGADIDAVAVVSCALVGQ